MTTPQAAADLITHPGTSAGIVIAEHKNGEIQSVGLIHDDERDGQKESELLAEYIAVVCERQSIEREEYLKGIIHYLNSIPKFKGGIDD